MLKISIVPLFISFFLWCTASQAALTTDEYTLILSRNEHTLLIIDLLTGVEYPVPVEEYPERMVLHDGKVYVFGPYRGCLTVVSLLKKEVEKHIPLGSGAQPVSMVTYENYGFVVLSGSNSVAIIDLFNGYICDELKDLSCPTQIVRDGTLGYVRCVGSDRIYVIDLEQRYRKTWFGVKYTPLNFIAHQGVGYVDVQAHLLDKRRTGPWGHLACVDLKTLGSKHTTEFPERMQGMCLYKDSVYFLMAGSIWTYNLTNQEFIRVPNPDPLFPLLNPVVDGIRYVKDGTYVRLEINHSFQELIHNPNNLDIDFSATHVYLGTKAIRGRPDYCFFDQPYEGLKGDFYGDGEDAFIDFIKSLSDINKDSTRDFFEKALAAAHPKAYAIAAYAFLHGKWGAEDQNLKWYREFSETMDKEFYAELTASNGNLFCSIQLFRG